MPCSVCKQRGHNKRSCPNSKPVETPTISKEVDECPICYEEIGDKNFCVTACEHKFCMGCIPKHLANSNACPMCRADILDEPITAHHGPGETEIIEIEDAEIYQFGYHRGHVRGHLDAAIGQLTLHRHRIAQEIRRLQRLLTENDIEY